MAHLELLNIHMTFDNRKNGLTNFFSLVMILGKDGFVG
jgi:hypothetical protein